jgi:hypothetical protein
VRISDAVNDDGVKGLARAVMGDALLTSGSLQKFKVTIVLIPGASQAGN